MDAGVLLKNLTISRYVVLFFNNYSSLLVD